jgi:hypothetical protein
MKVDKLTRDLLLQIQKDNRLSLEGNILKVLEADEGDVEFSTYLYEALNRDKGARKKRLDVTKQVQQQNTELLNWKRENEELTNTLKTALNTAEIAKEEALTSKEHADEARILAETMRLESEKAKDSAIYDLDIIQKRTQNELISTIVKVALVVIMSVGIITTFMYGIAMFTEKDTQIIGSTWSNMFGILLTNAFSIVGTIMGVKYASETKNNNE